MAIQTYFDQLKRVLDRYATASFVLDVQVTFELRPGDQGYVFGIVLFHDQSALHFREYLDGSANQVSRLMYVYHYQDAAQQLVFRYDNARHRPALSAPEHKHTADSVFISEAPTLEAVLMEIAASRQWL